MGLEEMLNSIKANTESQYAKTISEAKSEAERIFLEAQKQAENISSQRKIESERELQEERQRTIASARLDAKRKFLEAKDEVLSKYEAEAMRYIQDDFVKSYTYRDFLTKMIKDGVSKIGVGAIVQVNASDRKILSSLSNPSDYELSPNSINSIGGAVIISPDGKRRVDNTIESIFNERKEKLRLQIADEIFAKNH